jgi:hypothetical protein
MYLERTLKYNFKETQNIKSGAIFKSKKLKALQRFKL